MMELDELASRQKHLEDLGRTISDTKEWVQGVLDRVGWTQEHLLQKDEEMSECPHNAGHYVPTSSLQKHTERCAILKQGYTRQQLAQMEEAEDHFNDKSTTVETITIDDETFFQILESVPRDIERGPARKRQRPLTADRAMTDLSRDERLAIYEYCVSKAKCAAKPTSLPKDGLMLLEDNKAEEKQGMTMMERRALERDLKRRRQTYRGKSTPTSKRSNLEILRDVIDNQMELLTKMWQRGKEAKEVSESREHSDSPRYRSTDRESRRTLSSADQHSRTPETSRDRSRAGSRDRGDVTRRADRDRPMKEEDSSSEKKSHKHKKHKKHKHKKDRRKSRSRERLRERSRDRERSVSAERL